MEPYSSGWCISLIEIFMEDLLGVVGDFELTQVLQIMYWMVMDIFESCNAWLGSVVGLRLGGPEARLKRGPL